MFLQTILLLWTTWFLPAPSSSMTWFDDLLIDGQTFYINTEYDTLPLDQLATPAIQSPRNETADRFVSRNCTRRGYHAIWEITNDRLYLTGLQRCFPDTSSVDMARIFGRAYRQGRVSVTWFTGQLPVLDAVDQVPNRFEFEFRKGRFVGKKFRSGPGYPRPKE